MGVFHTGVRLHENQRLDGGSLSEKHCVGKACDCVCVLNNSATRPDRGVNEVRSSLLQRFPPFLHLSICLHTHISASVLSLLQSAPSSRLDKQELNNKRASLVLLTSLQLSASHEGRASIQLNTDSGTCCVCVCVCARGSSKVNL